MRFEELNGKGTDELLAMLGAAAIEEVAPGELPSEQAPDYSAQLISYVERSGEEEKETWRRFGRGVLRRVSVKLHARVCFDGDPELTARIIEGKAQGAVVLAGVLIGALTELGLSVAISTIIATILVTDVLDAVAEEMCEVWGRFNSTL